MTVSELSTKHVTEPPGAESSGTGGVVSPLLVPELSIRVAMLVLALAYFASGKLGLLLALPPGYATAVFPPSGIALAGMLIYGARAWPAVWIGSFAMNASFYFESGVSGAGPGALMVAVGIASGASLQAFVGALLVRRYARPDHFLVAERSVCRLLILGGPVGCLVSASIGSFCLLLDGALPREQLLYSWGTWWVGDTIGVLVFTPLTLIWLGWRAAMPLRRRLAVTIPMVVSFGLVVLLYVYTSGREESRVRRDFETMTDSLYQALVSRLDDYLVSLDAIERFVSGSGTVTRKDFAHVATPFLRRYAGVEGYSWDPVVSDAERAAVESAAREDGFPGFELREIGPDGQLVRAAKRSWYLPVRYIEPLGRNARVLGFDVMSEADRREALELARDSGRVLATKPFTLVQGREKDPGLIVYRPVYLRGEEPTTVEERRRKLHGFVAGVFHVRAFVESALEGHARFGIGLRARDSKSAASVPPLYDSADSSARPGAARQDLQSILSKRYSLDVAGRTWELDFVANQGYVEKARSLQSWTVLGAGMLFTGLLGAFLMILTSRSVRTEETNKRLRRAIGKLGVAEATAVANERRFRALLEAAPESIIGFDRAGVCTFCNPASIAVFAAASADDLVGKPVRALLADFVAHEAAAQIAHAIERGAALDLPMVEFKHSGARHANFECWVRPKMHDGICVGCVVGFMDISERIREHRELDHERRRLAAVLDSIEVGVIACDAQGEMVIYNRAMTRINGLADDATTAEKIAARANWRYPGEARPLAEAELPLLRALAGESVRDQEICLQIPGKAPQLLVVTGKHLSDAEGRTVGAVIAVHDVTVRQRAIESQHEANARLAAGLERLRRVNDWAVSLGEWTSALQSCAGIDEAYTLTAKFMQRLFPARAGALYVPEPGDDRLVRLVRWGTHPSTETTSFAPQECWALRRGHVHWVSSPALDPVCPHVQQDNGDSRPYVCIPLSSPNERLGVISLELGAAELPADEQQFAETLSTQVSVAVANIKLRDTLMQQSIRDPLTGLFNRRYLEDALGRELLRAERAGSAVSLAILDVDHFKAFNDQCGHDAGDAVLRAVAEKLTTETRRSDITCRFGGEEFVVLMPDASLAAARRRAENLRIAISRIVVIYGGQALPTVTASVGVATFPEHGRGATELLQSADAALYEAKRMGRNQVVAITRAQRTKAQKAALR